MKKIIWEDLALKYKLVTNFDFFVILLETKYFIARGNPVTTCKVKFACKKEVYFQQILQWEIT